MVRGMFLSSLQQPCGLQTGGWAAQSLETWKRAVAFAQAVEDGSLQILPHSMPRAWAALPLCSISSSLSPTPCIQLFQTHSSLRRNSGITSFLRSSQVASEAVSLLYHPVSRL